MDQRMDMDEAVAGSGCFPRFSCPIATRRMMGLDPWMGWLYLRRGLSVFFSLPGWMSSTPRVLGGGMGGVFYGVRGEKKSRRLWYLIHGSGPSRLLILCFPRSYLGR